MEISSIALGGLEQASARFDKAASQLSNAASPQSGDSVDLSTAAVELLTARNQFSANLKTVRVADDMEQALLNGMG